MVWRGVEAANSPLVGEMSGRTEGGAVERRPRDEVGPANLAKENQKGIREAPAGQRPLLPCRASPSLGGHHLFLSSFAHFSVLHTDRGGQEEVENDKPCRRLEKSRQTRREATASL
ncbi:hypothetical protein FJ567_15030 [Mesorhizobium sp. B2-4-16]|nr:hypothetical protein FJ567_15030 [Mesorhizobium sp. B2-4-16]TPL66298.1 hypothetical protein FJ956_20015 [Mesorhizobium sp. B2-4-3]